MLHKTALAVVWEHRSLLVALVKRDFLNRYTGSIAGTVWVLLNPLALLVLYAVVFEAIFKVKVPNLSLDQPYVLFIAVVLWPWMAFQEGLSRGTTAILNHGALVKKVAFEHELLVYSAVLTSFMVHSLGYALVLCVLGLMGLQLHMSGLLMAFLMMPALMVLGCGLTLLLSALQVFIRDVEQILSQALMVLFYATPILFPMSLVPDWLARVMQFNPLVHVTEPLRNNWLGLTPFAWLDVGLAWLLALVCLAVGRWVFLRLSPYFEDMV
jgi:ABC-type polysaccharide/polyol phosphate export permease